MLYALESIYQPHSDPYPAGLVVANPDVSVRSQGSGKLGYLRLILSNNGGNELKPAMNSFLPSGSPQNGI
jgi:hypothetical protein